MVVASDGDSVEVDVGVFIFVVATSTPYLASVPQTSIHHNMSHLSAKISLRSSYYPIVSSPRAGAALAPRRALQPFHQRL